MICGGLTELSPGARMAIDDVKAYDPKKRVWVTGEEECKSVNLPTKMPMALSYLSAGERLPRSASILNQRSVIHRSLTKINLSYCIFSDGSPAG